MLTLPISLSLLRHVIVHGGWGDWGAAGDCQATCQTARVPVYKAQQRPCNNPEPAHGGNFCEGPSSRRIRCRALPYCPSKCPGLNDHMYTRSLSPSLSSSSSCIHPSYLLCEYRLMFCLVFNYNLIPSPAMLYFMYHFGFRNTSVTFRKYAKHEQILIFNIRVQSTNIKLLARTNESLTFISLSTSRTP